MPIQALTPGRTIYVLFAWQVYFIIETSETIHGEIALENPYGMTVMKDGMHWLS